MAKKAQSPAAPAEADEMTKEQLIDEIMSTIKKIWEGLQNG